MKRSACISEKWFQESHRYLPYCHVPAVFILLLLHFYNGSNYILITLVPVQVFSIKNLSLFYIQTQATLTKFNCTTVIEWETYTSQQKRVLVLTMLEISLYLLIPNVVHTCNRAGKQLQSVPVNHSLCTNDERSNTKKKRFCLTDHQAYFSCMMVLSSQTFTKLQILRTIVNSKHSM